MSASRNIIHNAAHFFQTEPVPKSQIHTNLANQYFAALPDQVYAASDLDHLFIEKHSEWNLPPSMTSYTFLQMLLTRTHLSQLRLRSHHYSSLILYSWEGKASPMSVALRIKKHSTFFSHGSAMWIHGLNENHKNIFLNNEHSPKPKSSSYLARRHSPCFSKPTTIFKALLQIPRHQNYPDQRQT
jgi:hypothetical protein